ncbi:MAG: DHH family phosphoesterase, partial [Lachnospiraceae bacterium]|nr:DHH family phosphoesterase [Lachnospiraceae bacterium]
MENLFADLSTKILDGINDSGIDLLTSYDEKKYKVHINSMNITQSDPNSQLRGLTEDDNVFVYYFYDQTDYYDLKQDYINNKQVTGFIYIDNYYEVAENMEDSKASMLIAMVDRKLTRYISFNKGILKKLEKDKYFFITTHKDIEDMIADRFSILEQTKEIIGGENIPLTLSIGVGYDGKSIESNHELARIAIDMALGRGGDQAVVKRGQDTLFFGGKSASTSTNVRVRSRVKATSFKETLDMKDKVLIMGHKNGDFDSFGASIRTYVMEKYLGKDVHIVVNSLTNVCEEMKKKFLSNDSYDKTMFMTGDEALNFVDDNTLLIMVDHNVGTISDEPRLLDLGLDLVVFDHHRVSANSVSDAILSYVDASASSTCELVTEIMIYFEDRIKLKQYEADSIRGGTILDTISSTYQTSAKTFDAAGIPYLELSGDNVDARNWDEEANEAIVSKFLEEQVLTIPEDQRR